MPIKVLPQTLINQIAAGEVVVRMANVVKELVENSIDAGATRIEIIVANEARDLEIRDDGCGMTREDAELSLQRHATSKINSVEDLFELQTRGFRGEALPSIASVSRLEIQTRPPADISGTRVVVEGGRIQRIEGVGCPPGTRIIVRDLFYNTPARLKFLGSVVSEMNSIMLMITRQAMAQPTIGFRVERDGRDILDLPAGQSLTDRFRGLMGSQVKKDPLVLGMERHGISIGGLLAHPQDTRSDRRAQYYFVNGRPFSSKAIQGSLEQACRGFVMVQRFPICCVMIDINPREVDFNVHPTKEEVRFQNERAVAGAVYHAAKAALEGTSAHVDDITLPRGEDIPREAAPGDDKATETGKPQAPHADTRPPGFFTSPDELVRRAFERKGGREQQTDWITEADKYRNIPPAQEPSSPGEKDHHDRLLRIRRKDGQAVYAGPGEKPNNDFWARGYDPEPLGQIAYTYIMVRFGQDLLIVDQHAVHERLVYLALKRRQRDLESQSLLIPITIELSPQQHAIMPHLVETFEKVAMEVSEFGPRTWAIQSLPADLGDFDPVPMVIEMIDDFEEARRINALEDLRDRLLIRTACHSAIRAGDSLSMERLRTLMAEVKAERLSFTCPHGRPTIVRLTKDELDRQFKRIV
ncbi:MAG: DNA mismatch repair endonuclease MutL [Candidatus Sumerlaeia bacterium]|nr:DNA mismatch repair endonuclease MutL [Candidatus Sumerlaeia bacterium]